MESLMRVRQHIAEGESRIASQRQRVRALRDNGHDATQAEELLDLFEQTQATLLRHLALEEAEAAAPVFHQPRRFYPGRRRRW